MRKRTPDADALLPDESLGQRYAQAQADVARRKPFVAIPGVKLVGEVVCAEVAVEE